MGGAFGLGTATWSNYMLWDRAILTPTVGKQDEGRRSLVIGVSDHLRKVRVTNILQVSASGVHNGCTFSLDVLQQLDISDPSLHRPS